MAIKTWGGMLVFALGSVVAGLALAFLLVMLAPQLLRPPPAANPPVAATSDASIPAPARVTYADAVQRAAPSVVNIYTARLVTERVAPSALEQMFGNYWPRYQQRVERSLGSGVIVDAQGHIVTNHHVIVNAESINVQLADGRTTDARVIGRDPDTDLAVLLVDLKPPVPVVPFGRSDRLKVGDVVLAIGNPIGLSQTVTHGIVSATGRQQLGLAYFEDFIQTDAAINAGNSGGALIDASGALVGINTAIIAKSLGVEGIGFAIPVNMVRGVLDDILTKGRVVRGWIGIVPQDITEEQAAQFGLARAGVLLTNLFRDSPALKAGLQPGDMLIEVDGTALHSAQDAITRVAAHRPGTTVTLRALRGSRPVVVHAQVIERPRNQ